MAVPEVCLPTCRKCITTLCSCIGHCSSLWLSHGQRLAILKKWRDFHFCRLSPGTGLSSSFPGIVVSMSPSNIGFSQTWRNSWTVRLEPCHPGTAGPFNPFSHSLSAEGLPLRMEAQAALRSCPCPSVLPAKLEQDGTLIAYTPFSSLLLSSLFLLLPSPSLFSAASVWPSSLPPISLSSCIFYFPLPPAQA